MKVLYTYSVLSIFALIFIECPVKAIPILKMDDYGFPVIFSGKAVVLMNKRDIRDYKNPDYNDSEWKRISFPSSWKGNATVLKNICWYRLHIRFPAKSPNNSIGVKFGVICDVDEFYFNGQLIGKTGNFNPRISAYDKERVYEIPTTLIRPGRDNVLAIRVGGLPYRSNGPYKGEFILDSFNNLQRSLLLHGIYNIFFIVLYIAMGFYFAVFFMRNTSDMENLFLSLFATTAALYLFFQTEIKYLLPNDFKTLKHIEYVALIISEWLAMPAMTLSFRKKFSLPHHLYNAIMGTSLFVVVISKSPKIWFIVNHYLIIPSLAIPATYFVYLAVTETKKDIYIKFMLSAYFILIITVFNDAFVYLNIYTGIKITKYGFFLVFIASAIALSNKLKHVHGEMENLKKGVNNLVNSYFDDRKLDEIIAIIKKNYNTELTREGLATMIQMNPDYLGKMFKKHTGKSIKEYINEVRIDKACEAIVKTDLKIIEIAFSVGFESLTTFNRVFNMKTGESPTQYRKRHRAGKS